MLGEMIGELRGRTIGQRALPDGKLETSIQQSGKFLGVEFNSTATFWAEQRPDGTIYGEGQGVGMGKDGEMVSFKGAGVGWFTGPGKVLYRGTLYFWTSSQKIARINKVATVYEYEADETGANIIKIWEWK